MSASVIADTVLCLLMGNAWVGDSFPLPEPESLMLLIAGAGAFWLLRRLR